MTLLLGCISGTSVDGLDIALLDLTTTPPKIADATTVPLAAELRDQLLELGQSEDVNIDALGQVDAALGEFIGTSIASFLADRNIATDSIQAIGSHGQTIRHRPPGQVPQPFTMQIGDASRIAEITHITTVADFRRRDVAAGGHGAPLVPPFHRVLFDIDTPTIVVNIGGISNITILDASTSGFDTGPGNCLMDSFCRQHTGDAYDKDGAWGAAGAVDESLLEQMLSDPYFSAPAPKSTGREYFNLAWLKQFDVDSLPPQDVQATLRELTARCICDASNAYAAEQVIVCGGGRLNQALMASLATQSNVQVFTSEEKGVDGDAIEAAAFAWLAGQAIDRQPGNEPAVTGADGYRMLGAIYPA